MKKVYALITASLLSLLCIYSLSAQKVTFSDNWSNQGLNLVESEKASVNIIHSLTSFTFTDIQINGEDMKVINMPGVFLPNDEGAPNLPGIGEYVAVPVGATAKLNILSMRTETYRGIEIAPAPRIPFEDDDSPLFYEKNMAIYGQDAFYPASPVIISDLQKMRGVDIVMLGVTPFQYNPYTKELLVICDIEFEIVFEGGNGEFGDTRYRNRWWDPIISKAIFNSSSLPEVNYNTTYESITKNDEYEYVIITIDDPDFLAWADTIREFRTMQGIITGVVTTDEIGGNSVTAIEDYIDNAYYNWSTPPTAVLLLGDYSTGSTGITSKMYSHPAGYPSFASDSKYEDVDNDDLPDIILARITANNADQLETMITKFIDYETNPPTDPDFYNHPITALGWQTERWFQICSETVGGFFKHVQGKDPVRINEVYGGNPAVDPWSTATNTSSVLGVFGPNGLGYIPANPSDLGNWSGGSASDVVNAINNGSFLLQHRDHGNYSGWGEPAFQSYNINSLTNIDNKLPFVFSINCQTGAFHRTSECFTEKFHRHTYNGENSGALGLLAATEVSYSFVNDTYVWGVFDNLFPDFMPNEETEFPVDYVMPAFGNANGKHFLHGSSWPYNTSNKLITYRLFHHHGGAFLTLYTEVPMDMLVLHDNVVLAGTNSFTVTADDGAFITLSHNGEMLGTAESDGGPQTMTIPSLIPGDVLDVVVTKQNYFRYHAEVEVIPANMAYVVYNEFTINDAEGNGDGILDYGESVLVSLTLENVGLVDAFGVDAEIATANTYVTVTDNEASFGDILSLQTAMVTDEYAFELSEDVEDGELITFNVEASDGDSVWNSMFYIQAHAPVMEYFDFSIDDAMGNGNGRLDPGETAEITVSIGNIGSSEAYNVDVALSCSGKSFITVENGPVSVGNILPLETDEAIFTVTAAENTPGGFSALFNVEINADMNISGAGGFEFIVGQFSALILDLDPSNHSGPAMMEAFEDLDLIASYATSWPEDLSIYKSVFVSLGIIFTGHELTTIESSKLVQYLNTGGKLYLEGRRTWYDDPAQPIHTKFNIDVVVDTWFEYDTIVGEHATFTSGMMFEFNGGSPYNDYYMVPEGSAFTIFTSPNPEYGCAVAYDEGSYKTIGCAFEFGDIVDGSSPSTKQRLMLEYLNFFGDIVTALPESEVEQHASLANVYPNPFNEKTTISFELDEDMPVTIEVFSIDGSKIATLLESNLRAGKHTISWDGTDASGQKLGGGVYLCTLRTSSVIATKKLIRY